MLLCLRDSVALDEQPLPQFCKSNFEFNEGHGILLSPQDDLQEVKEAYTIRMSFTVHDAPLSEYLSVVRFLDHTVDSNGYSPDDGIYLEGDSCGSMSLLLVDYFHGTEHLRINDLDMCNSDVKMVISRDEVGHVRFYVDDELVVYNGESSYNDSILQHFRIADDTLRFFVENEKGQLYGTTGNGIVSSLEVYNEAYEPKQLDPIPSCALRKTSA